MSQEEVEYEEAGSKGRTVLILMAIAMIGAPFVLWNYWQTTQNQNAQGRPPIVSRLQQNFAFSDQNKNIISISDLEGKVWCYTAFTIDSFHRYSLVFDELKTLSKQYGERDDFRLVVITLDPEKDRPEALKAFAQDQGLDTNEWLFLSAGPEKLRKYVKNQLKLDIVYQKQVDGKKEWVFPSFVGLVGKNRHIRQRYDFEFAANESEERQKDLKVEPRLIENEIFKARLNAPKELQKTLHASIEHLFSEDLSKR